MTAFPEDREKTLAAAFVSLADTLVNGCDLMDRLTTHCVELVPADAAGLLVADRSGGLNIVSSSSERAQAEASCRNVRSVTATCSPNSSKAR